MRKFYECKECECNCRVSFVYRPNSSETLLLYMLTRCSIATFVEYEPDSVLLTKVDYVQPYRFNWPFLLYIAVLVCAIIYIVDYLAN